MQDYKSQYAPIALFVYKRLGKTQEVINSLKNNNICSECVLYVFSDGAKGDEDRKDVVELRRYLREIDGFKNIVINEREENIGLARNIVDGVGILLKKYGKVVVIEDDIVVGKNFLKYMNDALRLYEDKKEVMEISGYIEPISYTGLSDSAFIKNGYCWGWATWEDRWKQFSMANKVKIYKGISFTDRYHFDLEGVIGKSTQLFYNAVGILDTWAVYWSLAIYRNDGLVLVPKRSLVKNIGTDGSGEHQATELYDSGAVFDGVIDYFPDVYEEDVDVRQRIKKYYKSKMPGLARRVWRKLILVHYRIKHLKELS